MSFQCKYCEGTGYHVGEGDVSVDALCFCQAGRDERALIYGSQNMTRPTGADLLNTASDERDKRMKIEGRKCCWVCDCWFTPKQTKQFMCDDCAEK